MQAYHRRGGEDRVTEVLATVLVGAPGFANELAKRVGLSHADDFAVATQEPVRPSCIIDLEIRASAGSGEPAWLLWSEHKLEARFPEGQLAKYAEAIRDDAGGHPFKLIAITLKQPKSSVLEEADFNDVCLLRWSDVIALAQNAGFALAGRAWRTAACNDRDDETARRLLREWLDFCDYGDVMEAPVEPLTAEAVEIVPRAEQVLLTVDRLTEAAFAGACSALDSGAVKERGDYWFADPPADTWLDDHECSLYARYDSDDVWAAQPKGTPVFAVGIFCEGEAADELRRNTALRQALDEDVFDASEGSGRKAYFDVGRSLPMATISSVDTLAAQERALQGFFEQTLRALSEVGDQADL